MERRNEFYRLAYAPRYYQAMVAGCELGLFTHLSRHPGSQREDIAARLAIADSSARVLLLGCCAIGLSAREPGGGYVNTQLGETYLSADSPDNWLAHVKFSQDITYRGLAHLGDSLRSGEPRGFAEIPGTGETLYERLACDPALERTFHECMQQLSEVANLAQIESPELAGVRHLLDVGGANGTTALRLRQRYPQLRVTVYDLPSVCELAEERFREAKLSAELQTFAGNFLVDPLPQGLDVDAVLFSRLLEIYDESVNRALYRKAYEILPHGAKVITWTIAAEDSEGGGLGAAANALYFAALSSGRGFTHTAAEHEAWMTDAGFEVIARRHSRSSEYLAIIGAR